jgi:3-oxoacyl-[acyl-carrier-protein] synthase-3
MIRSVLTGCGSALPRRVVTNAQLVEKVQTSDEWIVQRTGIRARHIAEHDETTVSLGTAAARAALSDAGLNAVDIDLVICATATPDHTFPSTASEIQAALGIEAGAAFDVAAVCSGFVFALATADKFLCSGSHRRALVIGAETFSRILDWNDRTTCVLFGDGAGAVVLEAREGKGDITDRGVLSSHIRTDGRYRDKLYVDGGPGKTAPGQAAMVGHLRMEGREVFRHAVTNLAETVEETFRMTGLTGADIDWFVPHQANRRIIDATAQKLGIGPERVVVTVDRHGNTSAASIPLAMADAHSRSLFKPGQLILIEAMGGGFTWGSSLIRW